MGLLSMLLGGQNPAAQFVADNRNTIRGIGAGLASGPTLATGLSNAVQMGAQGGPMDDVARLQRKQAEDQAKLKNATRDWFAQKFPDLAQMVDAGMPVSEAWQTATQRMQPQAPVDPTSTATGRQQLAAQYGLTGADATSYILTGKLPDGSAPPEPQLTTIYDANGREQKGYMQNGQFVPVGHPKATTERPEYNASQATAAGYADRMAQADALLSQPNLAAVQTDLGQRSLAGIPVIGNMMTSAEFQQAEQAQRDFINAILRRESGAVIAQSEFDNAKRQYFPQPGDSEQVLQQKAANRRNAIAGVARAAGPAYQMPDTTSYLTGAPADGTDPSTIDPASLPQPQTQQDYDALPSGALFIDPDDGQIYKKD